MQCMPSDPEKLLHALYCFSVHCYSYCEDNQAMHSAAQTDRPHFPYRSSRSVNLYKRFLFKPTGYQETSKTQQNGKLTTISHAMLNKQAKQRKLCTQTQQYCIQI